VKGQRLLDAVSARLIDFVKEFADWERPRVEGTQRHENQ
jgi:hypothetical protein